MLRPSGDHLGTELCSPTDDVNWMGLEPSPSHTQISYLPDRVDLKAIRVPSGEYSGSSSVCVEEMNLTGGRTTFPPWADIPPRQISKPPPPTWCEKTSRSPC